MSLRTAHSAMVEFVHQRISALLAAPDAWGAPEAVELQVLLLLEMWQVTEGAAQEMVDGVSDRYDHHISRAVPGPPVLLAARLGLTTHANDRFVEVLRAFVKDELTSRREQRVLRGDLTPSLPRQDRPGLLHLEA